MSAQSKEQKQAFNRLIAKNGKPEDSDIISGFRSFEVPPIVNDGEFSTVIKEKRNRK